jgi:hypothetical protein
LWFLIPASFRLGAATLSSLEADAMSLVPRLLSLAAAASLAAGSAVGQPAEPAFTNLFAKDGPVREGWVVRTWADVTQGPKHETVWEVKDGILYGGKSPSGEWVGTWLFSEREYENFILEVDFKFVNGGAKGNGGVGLRAPLQGRPSMNGMELQITDPRYEFSLYRHGGSNQLTGAIYKALPPIKQVYNPGEWNRYRIELRGPAVKVWLNDTLIQDADLDKETTPVKTDEGGEAPPLAARPRRGRIGFQDLSNLGEQLLFRNARIAVLD